VAPPTVHVTSQLPSPRTVHHCVDQMYSIADGAFIRYIGEGKGSKPGRFDHPYGVAIDASSSTVFVADQYNHRIQVTAGSVCDACVAAEAAWG
jgi:hypothetical protein